MAKKRLDVLLFEKGLCPSRERAKTAIMEGIVYIAGQKAGKAGDMVDENAELEVRGNDNAFVSRGGKKIEKGKLRGVESNGMMCGLYELGLDERDFPYAAIVPAAILNDYHPLDKDKPSIPADIQPGDKVFGPVVCAKILECASQPDYTFHTCLDLGGSTAVPDTICPNLHEGDLVAYNTKADSY